MSYPTRILPSSQHKSKISPDDCLELILLRHTDLQVPIFVPVKQAKVGGKVEMELLDKAICDGNSLTHMPRLSVNLVGHFTTQDISIQVNRGSEYGNSWNGVEDVPTPELDKDYTRKLNRKYWCIRFNKIHGEKISYRDKTDEIARCEVLHDPVRWNYWHFEVRWYLLHQKCYWHDLPENEKKKKPWSKNDMKFRTKELIRKWAQPHPTDSIIPDHGFLNNP